MAITAPEERHRHRLTATAYFRMGETGILPADARVELLEGDLFDMAPIGSSHAATLRRLGRLAERMVGDAAIVSIQNPVLLDAHSAPQPDLALLKPRDDFYASRHPTADDILLIVEVSDSTLSMDRTLKARLYAEAGLVEYWVIDIAQHAITVFRDARDGQYKREHTYTSDQVVASQHLPQLTFPVLSIF